ncbi:MAG: anti-sigma factor [Chloroflexi bacterium]|nr:anti-sigma factor [Chloroflexota bacterium]
MRHEYLEELLEACVAGALAPGERRAVKRHLNRCDSCLYSVKELQEAASSLAYLPPQVAPPSGLLQGIMAQARRGGIPRPRPWPPLRMGYALAAFFTVSLLLAGWYAYYLTDRLDRLAEQNRSISLALQQNRSMLYYVVTPGTRVVLLSGTQESPDSYGMLLMNPELKGTYIVAAGMRPLPPDKAYQVWLLRDEERVSAGLFAVDESGWGILRIRPPIQVLSYRALGITVEPTAGNVAPSTPRIMGGDIQQ